MRTSRNLCAFATLLGLGLFPTSGHAAKTAAGPILYDFRSQSAVAALDGHPAATWRVRGVPLAVQAGLLDQDGHFTPAAADAVLAVLATPVPDARGAGLGVLSSVPSLSFPEEGLSMAEGLVFHFAPGFQATRIALSDFTQGPDDFGDGTFEAVRLFADGHFLGDVPGVDGGEVTIDLPPGIRVLALTPLFQTSDEIPTLSSDPVVRALRALYGPLHDHQILAVPLQARLRDGTPLVGEDLVLLHAKKD